MVDKDYLIEIVNAGNRLTFEFERLATVETVLHQRMEFTPVLAVVGWSSSKELVFSLRIRLIDANNNLLGQCLVDLDEVRSLNSFLSRTIECREQGVSTKRFEFATRHGFVYEVDVRVPFHQMYIASQQPALIRSTEIMHLVDSLRDFIKLADDLGVDESND